MLSSLRFFIRVDLVIMLSVSLLFLVIVIGIVVIGVVVIVVIVVTRFVLIRSARAFVITRIFIIRIIMF